MKQKITRKISDISALLANLVLQYKSIKQNVGFEIAKTLLFIIKLHEKFKIMRSIFILICYIYINNIILYH